MLNGDGHTDRRLGNRRTGLAAGLDHWLRERQSRERLQGLLFKDHSAMAHLHFAGDVQIMPGIRLRQIPTIFGERCECGNCKQQQRKECAPHKWRQRVSQL